MDGILLLTGAPGVGKTTLCRRLAGELRGRGLVLQGFTTEEIRRGGRRVGFRIVPFAGEPRVLAHVDYEEGPRVGRYRVDVPALDAVVEEALAVRPEVDLYLIDEIGKMECFSGRFTEAVRRILDSGHGVVATVALRGGGLIADVKRSPAADRIDVTRGNRLDLLDTILRRVLS